MQKTPNQNGQPEAPKIEFPCENYPVKVLGVGAEDYLEVVFAIVQKHAPECDKNNVKTNASSKGSFQSCTFYITATGIDQLGRLHSELQAHEYVRMVI